MGSLGQLLSSLGQLLSSLGQLLSSLGQLLSSLGQILSRLIRFYKLGFYQFPLRLDRSIEKVDNKRFKLNLQQRHSDYLIDSNSSGTHLAQIWLISRFFMEHFQAQWENSGFDGKGV